MKKCFIVILCSIVGFFFDSIYAQTTYPLYVAGIQVTESNASDINSSDISGSVTYNAATQTLTLNGATIEAPNSENGIKNDGIKGLVIELIGNNKVTAIGSKAAIFLKGNTAIAGKGTLLADNSDNGGILINVNTTLFINNEATVIATGKYGIAGEDGKKKEKLSIQNATVKAIGTSGSIIDLSELELIDCVISQPVGAQFNPYSRFVEADGSKVTTEIVIESNLTNISSQFIDKGINYWTDNGVLYIEVLSKKASDLYICNISGQLIDKVSNSTEILLPKGIYIIRSGNLTEKIIVK